LPFPTLFSSYNWDNETIGELTGEKQGTIWQGEQLDSDRPWKNGAPVAPDGYVSLPEPRVCGTADQWAGDLLVDRDLPLGVDINGGVSCCTGLPPWPTHIPIVLSGFAEEISFGGINLLSLNGSFYVIGNPRISLTTWTALFGQARGTGGQSTPVVWTLTRAPDGSVSLVGVFNDPYGSGFEYTLPFGTFVPGRTIPAAIGVIDPNLIVPAGNAEGEVLGYAAAEEADMLIGAVVWDAGADAVPARYLVCDGSLVSRSVYSLLFGRLGITYGPGDGSTTFNLPDLRDLVPVGSGMAYGTGAKQGSNNATLVPNNLPAHVHPVTVTDPKHHHEAYGPEWFVRHTPGLATGNNLTGATGTLSVANITNDNATGITAAGGNNTTTNDPVDVRNKSLALRPLIYAGV
jgi:microcystin-dependent protein